MAKAKDPSSTASSISETSQEQEGEASNDDLPETARKSSHKPSNKPRLTAHQKNTNHKDAENKRRTAIREQFKELSEIVPNAENLERSEFVMLQKTVEHFREQVDERRKLVKQIQAKGLPVPEHLKLQNDQWGEWAFKAKNVEEFNKAKAKRKGNDSEVNGDGEGDD